MHVEITLSARVGINTALGDLSVETLMRVSNSFIIDIIIIDKSSHFELFHNKKKKEKPRK